MIISKLGAIQVVFERILPSSGGASGSGFATNAELAWKYWNFFINISHLPFFVWLFQKTFGCRRAKILSCQLLGPYGHHRHRTALFATSNRATGFRLHLDSHSIWAWRIIWRYLVKCSSVTIYIYLITCHIHLNIFPPRIPERDVEQWWGSGQGGTDCKVQEQEKDLIYSRNRAGSGAGAGVKSGTWEE